MCVFVLFYLSVFFFSVSRLVKPEGGDVFMLAPCPPEDHLHLVCDRSIGIDTTCSQRVVIIEQCLHKFSAIYNNLKWCTCVESGCHKVVDFLVDNRLIEQAHCLPDPRTTTLRTNSADRDRFANDSVITDVDRGDYESVSDIPADEISSKSVIVTRTPISRSNVTMGTDKGAIAEEFPPPVSYLYPVIGSLFILIEIAVLCAL